MMEGLEDSEIDQYLEESPKIIPLFEIDLVEIVTPYINNDDPGSDNQAQPNPKSFVLVGQVDPSRNV